MAEMLCKTKGNGSPKGKPRVYFTCHPEDFETYFEKVCEDIFASHDCAVYYTADMNAAIEEKETDLESNNLFVVPVTFKLLSTPNRAMDEDIPFAKEHHIPVLPIMMETGIDSFYSREEKFGEMQYLRSFCLDDTEVPYEEKLKKHLESVLISDELAQKIRAAFDAYIFLSYRKKDRKYANELMRIIHAHPECRDIAIWYDEFLTPGESFRESIEKILESSKLFTLLVTPNLLEEQNFVMREEYPAAKNAGIPILPAEMEKTDKAALQLDYQDIPDCIDPHDAAFKERLVEALRRVAVLSNDNDPMHNYLIGLAYMEGIDVEVDRKRGLELVTMAGKAGLPKAMERLNEMYENGDGVPLDYRKAAYWAGQLASHYEKTYGWEDPDTLALFNNYALACGDVGQHQKALEILEKVYKTRCALPEQDPNEINKVLENIAVAYGELGEYEKGLQMLRQVYDHWCSQIGEETEEAMRVCGNLAIAYGEVGDYQKERQLLEKVYQFRLRLLGQEHPSTLATQASLAMVYDELGEYEKALQILKENYERQCRLRGKSHPAAINALQNLSMTYAILGDYRQALAGQAKVYQLQCEVLGGRHPDTLISLFCLSGIYNRMGDFHNALQFQKKTHRLQCKVLGREHPDTLATMDALGYTYYQMGDYEQAAQLQEETLALRQRILGREHPLTGTTMNNLAATYSLRGELEKARQLQTEIYQLQCRNLGEEHPVAIKALNNVGYTYAMLGELENAFRALQSAYDSCVRVLGKDHPDTLQVLNNLGHTYYLAERSEEARELLEAAYEGYIRLMGENHPETQTVANNLALALVQLGQLEKAISLQSRVYEAMRKIWGPEHPNCISFLYNLAVTYCQAGRLEQSLELHRQLYELLEKDTPMAAAVLQNGLEISRQLGDTEKLAYWQAEAQKGEA